jgi:predicted lipoprotein with Yx(FWY)xxD motif
MHALSRLTLALLLPLALFVAACSSSGASPSAAAPTEAPASEAPASEAPASEAPASEAPTTGTVNLSENALGMILTDAEGKVLYGFTNDTGGVPACYDDCAAAWPPLTGEATVGAGLDAALLTTVERTDGTTQLKYGDWPLYYFANDAAAGDTNGQGLNEVWFVIGADGALIGQ